MQENKLFIQTETIENNSQIRRPSLIAINVSADGINPCLEFLESVDSSSTSVVLFLAENLAPEAVEEYIATIQKFTVASLTNSTPLTPGKIYIIPQTTYVEALAGSLQLLKNPDYNVPPIDIFLFSLAQTQKNRSVVLFFTTEVSHCIEGLKEVREQSGLILRFLFDKPAISQYEQSALLDYLIDGAFSIRDMAHRVYNFLQAPVIDRTKGISLQQEDLLALEQLFHRLHDATGVHFSDYDLIYLLKRIKQRLRVGNLASISEYVAFTSTHPYELTLLGRRLSLKRTSFFHHRKVMQYLSQYVIPSLVVKKNPKDVLRVWVPSCATGEEVYSIAILLNDALSTGSGQPALQIIGTDSDLEILQLAGRAQFLNSSVRAIPAYFAEKYFHHQQGLYHADELLVKQLHFSKLDVTDLPPYSNLDLIFCSGLLQRMKKEQQTRILKKFHAALAPEGFLVLSEGEKMGNEVSLFTATDPNRFIFTPIAQYSQTENEASKVSLFRSQNEMTASQPSQPNVLSQIEELHKDLTLQLRGTVSILIKPDFTILDQIGHAGLFIAWPNNGKTANLLHAFPTSIQSDLSEAVNQSLTEKKSLQSKILKPQNNGILQAFKLQMHPLYIPELDEALIQVLFLPDESAQDAYIAKFKGQPLPEVVKKLESDLRRAKDKLNLLTQQLEERKALGASGQENSQSESDEWLSKQNSELRNTNEELLALNRDLVGRVEGLRKKVRLQQTGLELGPETNEIDYINSDEVEIPDINALRQQLAMLVEKRHEMRTALTSIIGFADLLTNRLYDADNKELARYIGKAGNRLSDSLDNLLTQDFEAIELPEKAEITVQDAASNRLLVVEDSDATRRLLSLVLGDRFECELAADANEAIEKAEKGTFKAVVMDINLGKGKSGVEVLHHLRRNARYQQVPFMAVTALASPQDESMLLGKGFDAYVAKPFQKAKLLTTLDRMLGQGNAA